MQPVPVEITIREFQPGDEGAFWSLNEAWIVRYFAMEPKDEELLGRPQEKIIDHGGRIFLAVCGKEAVGCCALIAMGPGEYELAKMAVSDAWQRAGIGRRLLEHAIAEARAMGATRLFLETNRKLGPAIRLYESVGFEHVPPVPSPYARCDVAMEMRL